MAGLYLDGPGGLYRLSSRQPRGRIPGALERLSDTEPRPRELDFPRPPPQLAGAAGPDQLSLAGPTFVAGPGTAGSGRPQINTTVNVEQPPAMPAPRPSGPPAGAAAPETDDERSLVSQGAWAEANASIAPLLGDYRTTPLQVIATALAGYNKGAYAAKQDVQDRRYREAQLKALENEAAMKQRAFDQAQARRMALEGQIAKLPPEQQDKARMLLNAGLDEQLGKLVNPELVDVAPGHQLTNPATGEVIVQGPPEQMSPYQSASLALQQQELALRQWEAKNKPAGESWRQLTPEETKAAGYPAGYVVMGNNKGEQKVTYSPTSKQAGSLPTGYSMVPPTDDAVKAGINVPEVAAPSPGTPDYVKGVDTIRTVGRYVQQLKDMNALFQKHGIEIWPSAAKGQMESLAGDMKLSYAQARGQGALQKTDDAVIGSIQGAVTSPLAWATPGGASQVQAQLNQALATAQQDLESLQQQYPWAKVKDYIPSTTLPAENQPKPTAAPASAPPVVNTAAAAADPADEHKLVFGF